MKYHFMQTKRLARWALTLTIAATPAIAAHADGVGIRTVTLTVNGSPMVFSLDKNPVITFIDNELHIKTTEKTTDVPVAEVSVLEFKGAPDRADANGDNDITAADLTEISHNITGQPSPSGHFEKWGADVNGDGKVDITDITEIIKKLMNH
jgi:hypothetical protein